MDHKTEERRGQSLFRWKMGKSYEMNVKQKRKPTHRNIVRTIFGIILIIAGIAWYLYPCVSEWMLKQDVTEVINEFEDQYTVDTQSAKDTVADMPEQTQPPAFGELYSQMSRYNDELSKKDQNLADAWDFEQVPLNLSFLGSGSAVGYIEIPDMKVKLPLYIGASHDNLTHGAAVLAGTSMPIGGKNTNCVICGHRGWHGSAYFRNIEDMQTGSLVYITNPWETLAYRAVSAKIISSSDLESIFIMHGKDMVTLFSCYPYAHPGTPYRYVVYCERIDNDKEQTMNTDMRTKKTTMKQSLSVDGIKVDQRTAAAEKTLLLWERRLRYILPLIVFLIAFLICVIRKKITARQAQ